MSGQLKAIFWNQLFGHCPDRCLWWLLTVDLKKIFFFRKKRNWRKKSKICPVKSFKNHIFGFSKQKIKSQFNFPSLISNFKNLHFDNCSDIVRTMSGQLLAMRALPFCTRNNLNSHIDIVDIYNDSFDSWNKKKQHLLGQNNQRISILIGLRKNSSSNYDTSQTSDCTRLIFKDSA